MTEKYSSSEALDYLEFTQEDIDRIEKIDQMVGLQYEAVEKDFAFRDALAIDQDRLDKMIEIAVNSIGVAHKLVKFKMEEFPMSADEKEKQIASIKAMQESDAETTEYYSVLISRLCENSNIDADTLLQSLKDRAVLFNVGRKIEKYIHEQSESQARELLKHLEEEALKVCDRCFTTSQKGSSTRTKKTEGNSQYDSIYFLYKMSNGTCVSQRFKRNLLTQAPLHQVIQPVLDLALFTRDEGPAILSEMKPGFYGKDRVLVEPEIDYNLTEYYSSENVENFKKGNLAEIKMANVVRLVDDGIIIKDEFVDAFDEDHEGTRVNAILK